MAKKGIPEIRIEPMEKKGSYLVHHTEDYNGKGAFPQPKKYAFNSHADMLAHVKKATTPKKSRTLRDEMDKVYSDTKK